MHFKNNGLTVGELSIAIVAILIVGFIWATLTKDKGNKEISMFINNSSAANYPTET